MVAGATTFAPVGSVSLDSQTSGRISIGRRLYGQARRQCIRPCVFYAEYAPYGSLQHGYHRLTGFSGCFRSPTNPVRWCDSSSLATPLFRGHYGCWAFRATGAYGSSGEKPNNRASPVEMHPFWCLWHHLPPEGGLLAALCNEQLKLAQGESIEQTSPSGGSTAAGGDRGAFPSGQRPGLPVFPRPTGRF